MSRHMGECCPYFAGSTAIALAGAWSTFMRGTPSLQDPENPNAALANLSSLLSSLGKFIPEADAIITAALEETLRPCDGETRASRSTSPPFTRSVFRWTWSGSKANDSVSGVDWTPMSPVRDFVRVIARMTGHMFAPPSVARDAAYQHSRALHA
jgi:hypothetical protein